ncbi:benzoate-CoA ligase [Alteribacillus persepolensis]|uniref:Benzoate-CoA ligase n=1 Tax=Alteribacillus persepolensis TaxID=568899 RepID=A0A1G8FP33_9BACI|nr:benzoate-CoA ligase family protein [Alteribacillus persepolensis]SDH83943.1 benzoate-CoA ligase [Alteribacillus persepolensis]
MIEQLEDIRGLKKQYNAALRFIDENANSSNKHKTAVVCDDQTLTYQEVFEKVNQFGNALFNINVESENRVLIAAHDSPEFVTAFFGSIKIGAVPIPVNTMMQPHDYEYFLNNSRAKVFVVHEDIWERIEPYRDRFLFLKHVIVIQSGNSTRTDVINFHEFVGNAASTDLKPVYTTAEDVAFWLYSSGSTGNPKGVIHRQRSMEAAYENYASNILNIKNEDRTFSASKLFFAYGLGNGLYFPFGAGATTIFLQERPTPERVFETIETKKPTIFFGVPTLYGAMINYVSEHDRLPDLSSIRVCVSAGEPLPAEYVKKWKELFNLNILDGIGSTEALHIYLSNREDNVKPGSTGTIVSGYDAKIVDETGRKLPPNEIGDLLIKGESITSGYWLNLMENYNKFQGEWMFTGDKYYQDEEGYFWYSGRSDDMLKVGGIWVSPIEIESTLLTREDVLETAVVGAKYENNLVYPKAYVVLKNKDEASDELKETLKLYVKQNLAPYKYPREVEFVDELPKTATGKIQRYKLKVDN